MMKNLLFIVIINIQLFLFHNNLILGTS